MKKILFITYYWPPSGGAGVQRPLKFVKYLLKKGFEVFVLTVNPAKASYPVLDQTLSKEIPRGIKLYYSDSFESLKILGMFISKNKIPYGGFANSSESAGQKLLRFIRGNFFIPDARVGWVNPSVKKAAEIILENNIENILISSPPHSSQLIGLKLKRKFPNIKWLADLRDPWTDIYYYKDLYHTIPAARLDKYYERKVLELCDSAMVVSPSIKKMFGSKSVKINPDKIHVVPNGYDESDFLIPFEKISDKEFILTYVGTMADSYSPELIFKVLKTIIADNNNVPVRLRIVGSISPGILKMIDDCGIQSNTEIISYIPHNLAIKEMQKATLLLLIIPDVKGANGILTGKLFEYIGSQRPILGIGPPEGDAAEILNDSAAGKMFSRNNPELIKKYLQDLLNNWKAGKDISFRSPAYQKYSRRNQSEMVAEIFNNLQRE